MRQVVQNYKTGELQVAEVPPPALQPDCVLVRNAFSVVSAGTEKSKIQLGRKSLLGKARARPDQLRQVIQSARREGLWKTYRKAMNKLDSLNPLGYSCAGTILETGEGTGDLQPGDPVACAGGGYANHAEVVLIPRNLCVRVPRDVDLRYAAFSTLGAIALQGIRQAGIVLGESVAVIGLGLIGQLTVQLLGAAGCRVFGIDLRAELVELARELGAQDGALAGDEQAVERALQFTAGQGVDAVIITAATASSDPVRMAGELARDRGRVVMVGDTGMDVPRNSYYQKELSLRLSRSYGPGRYDTTYEEKGIDYPIGYVRWTEGRNMGEFIRLLAEKKLRLDRIITHAFPVENALQAYRLISGKDGEFFLGVLLEYPAGAAPPAKRPETSPARSRPSGTGPGAGVIGAGSFAQGTLLPILADIPSLRLVTVADASGTTARRTADRYGFAGCTSDHEELLRQPEIDCVFIATRHHLHAAMAREAVEQKKAVFLEKPLAMNLEELREISRTVDRAGGRLMVGFNRRFAPLVQKAVDFLRTAEGPLAVTYRINAGPIAPDHWVQDPRQGGGRIIGEVCHFADLICYLTGQKPEQVFARALSGAAPQPAVPDNVMVTMQLTGGCGGTIQYLSVGDPAFPKERIEIFGRNAVVVIDDFRALQISRGGRSRRTRSRKQDKGHRREIEAFVDAIREGGDVPVPFEDAQRATLVTFQIAESLRTGQPVPVDLASALEDR